MRHVVILSTLIVLAMSIVPATAATPEQAGTYEGTASMTYHDPSTGKVKSKDSIAMSIDLDNTITVTLGNDEYTSSFNPVYATGGGFHVGTIPGGFAFTIYFEFKGKNAIKGSMHYITPYGATTGKVKMKKVMS